MVHERYISQLSYFKLTYHFKCNVTLFTCLLILLNCQVTYLEIILSIKDYINEDFILHD